MTERIRIVVQASKTHPQFLTVEDAMRQVLAFFELLPEQTEADDLVWAIAAASMASPLVVEAEAKSIRSGVDISLQARKQKETLDKRLRAVQRGEMPPEWAGTKRASVAIALLKRNTNGVGKTEVSLESDEPPVVFDEVMAQESLALLSAAPVHQFKAHQEIGSIEGKLISAGSYYGEPVIHVEDRRNGERIVCLVPADVHDLVVSNMDIEDVWTNRRVSVHGRLSYDDKGNVKKVVSDRIEKLPTATVTIKSLYDPEFTEGLDPVLYLEQWREGA